MPSTRTPNVLVFSDKTEGTKYGYQYDGPSADGRAFYYTGRGTAGDQTEIENRPIIDHLERGRALRLFVAAGKVPGSGTTIQRYVGEFRLDPGAPFRRAPAPDRFMEARTVLVFRLLPVDAESASAAAEESGTPIEPGPDGNAVRVPLEVNSTEFYETSPSGGGTATKLEALLVQEFVAARGVALDRWAITVPGEKTILLTDVFDEETSTLYEAKASASRVSVRTAVGQLLDYRRHVPVPALKCAVLLPARPSDDLCGLIESAGLGLVYRTAEGFVWA